MRSRLEAAHAALNGCDASLHAPLSQVHSRALCAMLEPIAASLGDEDKVDLSSRSAAVSGCGEDGNAVVRALVDDGTAGSKPKKPRRDMQDMKAFISYFTAAEWEDTLLNVDVPMNSKGVFLFKLRNGSSTVCNGQRSSAVFNCVFTGFRPSTET